MAISLNKKENTNKYSTTSSSLSSIKTFFLLFVLVGGVIFQFHNLQKYYNEEIDLDIIDHPPTIIGISKLLLSAEEINTSKNSTIKTEVVERSQNSTSSSSSLSSPSISSHLSSTAKGLDNKKKTSTGFLRETNTTESKATYEIAVRNSCFGSNSDEWIYGNIESNNDDGFTPDLVETLFEAPIHFQKLPSLFNETICHEDSPIRSFPQIKEQRQKQQQQNQHARGVINEEGVDVALIEDWYQRFLYLALHWKFHQPALQEYRARKTCAEKDVKDGTNYLQSFMMDHEIGQMDYECKDAKFVVIPIGSIGFGAYLNTMASLSILLALRTNRIPIFTVRSIFPWQKRKGERDPWLLAPNNCSRKDMQCYFLPISPCTITKEDLLKAPIYGVDRKEQQFLRVNVTVPPEIENERIVVLNSGLVGKTIDTPDMRNIAFDIVSELLEEWKKITKKNHLMETICGRKRIGKQLY